MPTDIYDADFALPDSKRPSAQLREEDRDMPFMFATDAWWNMVYHIPGFHPDALIAHKGWDEIDQMLEMSAYSSPLCIKKFGILHQTPKILSAVQVQTLDPQRYDRAQRARDLVQYVMDNIWSPETDRIQPIRELLWDLCDAFHRGVSCVELLWRTFEDGPYAGLWGLQPAIPRHPKQLGFRLHPKTLEVQEIMARAFNQGPTVRVPVEKCLLLTYNSQSHIPKPYGWGHCRPCWKHYFSLNMAYRDYGVHVERNAGGLLIGEVMDNSDLTRRKMHALLTMARQTNVLVYTKGYGTISLQQPTMDSSNIFMSFVEMHSGQMTQDILGQQLTTQQNDSRGSFALGQIQENVQESTFAWGRGDLQDAMERLFRRIVSYNLGREYMDVVPTCSLGVYNIQTRTAMSKLFESFAKYGDLHREEGFIREELQFPPRDPALSDYQTPGEKDAPDPGEDAASDETASDG